MFEMCLINYSRNYLCIIFVVLSLINISSTLVSSNASFSQSETCILQFSNGLKLDLSPLLKSDQPIHGSTTTSLYIYNPCNKVPLNTVKPNECQCAYALCYFEPKEITNEPVNFNSVLSGETAGKFTLLAKTDESVLRENEKKEPEIVYINTPKNATAAVRSFVRLICNEAIDTYKLSIDKTAANLHELTLSTKYACVKEEHHLSGGAVFLIILIVFAALYFIGGILVLKFIRGATGIEMIPNHEFWCKLPQLAKDGIAHLTSCGRSTPDSYEKI